MNNQIKMKDLFQNPEMVDIFPQFTQEDKLQNVYSFEWIEKKVKEYLRSSFDAQIYGNNIVINGTKDKILKDVQTMKWTIEAFFNNMPSIVKNVRHNTQVYTPFKSISQIKNFKTQEEKLAALNIILDNLNYNPDFGSLNTVKVYNTKLSYYERQNLWQNKVGYRRDRWEK